MSRQLVDDVLKYKRLDGVNEALKKLSSSLFADGRQQAQLGDALSRVTIPTMIIWGEDDEIIPAKHAAALTGQARTHLIGGTGHMVQMEAASTVNALLKEHIRAGRLSSLTRREEAIGTPRRRGRQHCPCMTEQDLLTNARNCQPRFHCHRRWADRSC